MLVLPVHQVSNLMLHTYNNYICEMITMCTDQLLNYQRLLSIHLEPFVLLMVMIISLDVLKSTGMEYGALFVMTSGI